MGRSQIDLQQVLGRRVQQRAQLVVQGLFGLGHLPRVAPAKTNAAVGHAVQQAHQPDAARQPRARLHADQDRLAAAGTLAVTASGVTLMGVGSAFWGLVFGLLILGLDRLFKR